MKKTILALVLVCSLFITDTALACKPGGNWPPTPKENIAQKDAVFVGTVQSVIQDKSINGEYRISFSVNQKYKGSVGDSVTVKTQSSSAACGYDNGYDTFKKGSVWVIYATGNAVEGYSTSSISVNTEHASVASAIASLAAAGVIAVKDEAPVMCTMQYAPVCGKKDTGIRCVTTPCPSHETKTYGNSCMLGADKAEFLYEGECTGGSTVTVTPKPPVSVDTSTTIDIDASGDVSLPAEAVVPPKVSFWQKIVTGFKGIFSFWK